MTTEILTGEAAASAGGEAEFSGFANPRNYRVSESARDRACSLLTDAFSGKFGAGVRLAEAFTTSDFKLAAFAQLDVEMRAKYTELPSQWKSYTDTTLTNDFRPKRLVRRGSAVRGMPLVPELTEYPADDNRFSDAYAIQVAKHGKRKALSWEAFVNNEAIDELEDMPAALAADAADTEAIAAASNLLLLDQKTLLATDVNTNFFKAGNGNAPANLPLTRDNLKTVLDGMAVKKDPNTKRVIARPDVVVVIPKALEQTMINIVAPRYVRSEVVNGSTTTITEIDNPLAGLSYVVEPLLDYMNTHAKAATTWFVVPKPGGPRPALWLAKLRGHETPDLRVKADTGQRVGGGAISAVEGSFDIDDIQYRGRHIVGNQTADALFTYASYGS